MAQQEIAIKRILRAANHFDLLQLRRPHADLMNQPVWEITGEQVHKAFRKLSLCCHPDKSTHPDAPRAFEALKKAKAILSNELDRDDYLHNFVRQQKVSWEGNWSSAEAAGETKQRVSSMREESQRAESDSVVDAMRERREKVEAAARKKQRVQQAQQRRAARQDDDAAADNEEEEEASAGVDSRGGGGGSAAGPQRPGVAGAARKRPRFL